MIKRLTLKNWRNWKNESFSFSPKTIMTGPNGVGKTNIVEAIVMLVIGKSWRAVSDDDVITWETEFTDIKGKFESDESSEEIAIFIGDIEGKRLKRLKVDGVARPLSCLSTIARTVIFSPDQIEQLSTPSGRRRYLDLHLIQYDKHYGTALRQYQKLVRAKNAILERLSQGYGKTDELLFWNQELVKEGTILLEARKNWFSYLNTEGKSLFDEVVNRQNGLYIEYRPRVTAELFADKIYQNTFKEVQVGVSLYGPHRDDWMVTSDSRDITTWGSRGQWRTLVALMKIIEAQYLTTDTIKPIILLDDVLSELDHGHRHKLLSLLYDYQTIITSAETPSHLKLDKQWELIELNG